MTRPYFRFDLGEMRMDYVLQSREHLFQPPNQGEPTAAKPGSREKLLVMTERYRAGQALHHPHDETCLDHRERTNNFLNMLHRRAKSRSGRPRSSYS